MEITAKIAAGYNGFQPEVSGDMEGLDYLWSLDAVRERSHKLLEIGLAGNQGGAGLPHFEVHPEKIDDAASKVIDTIATRYPKLDIPIHSRYRHFEVGGIDRVGAMELGWSSEGVDAMEAVRRKIDLVVVSVLLDAGAGAAWSYVDKVGATHSRSEGLAMASLDMFKSGAFAGDAEEAGSGQNTVDASRLATITAEELGLGFQVSEANPIAGLEGRAEILRRLGIALQTHHEIFQRGSTFRPGNLLDHVLKQSLLQNADGNQNSRLSMRVLWKAVVEGLQGVFPDPSGQGLGDCFSHPALGDPDDPDAMIPFHKLSQWLTYSLIEPFGSFGIKFVDGYLLTGLAEYRNGGLFLDTGVLTLRDPSALHDEHLVSDTLVVEWRGLTVALLDKTAERIWDRLGMTSQQMPLAKILEGGTWAAGRELAFERRPGGEPPIRISSTGDVF